MSAFSGLPLVIEPADLAARLDDPALILIDLGNATRYSEGHLPHARFVDPKQTQRSQSPTPGLLPSAEQLNALFGTLGHHPQATYVLYDDEGGSWAGRFAWILDSIGHTDWHYLNGGLKAWQAEGYLLTQEIPSFSPQAVNLELLETPTASIDYLKSRLQAADLMIWDARSPEEYRGEKLMAARGGHIPGAINLEWTACMDPERALRIRADIAELLKTQGITPDKEIITHCQTHRRSGFTYLLARALGYPRVKAYAGSWGEWGNMTDTPIVQ